MWASRIPIEDAADTHTAAAHPMTTTNSCGHLPGEIWGLICAEADDFTLWVVYRQVSKLVRSEAEREFARTRLPELRINLTCSAKIPGLRYTSKSIPLFPSSTVQRKRDENGSMRVDQGVCLGEDGQQARLKLDVHFPFEADDVASRYMEPSDGDLLQATADNALKRALEDTDIDIERKTYVSTTLGSYTNNNPLFISKMDVRSNECFIDFKSFLCAFYGDYARVGRLLDPQNSYQAVLALLATFKDDITKIVSKYTGPLPMDFDDVLMDIRSGVRGPEVARLFEQAYFDRVKRSCARRGIQSIPGVKEVMQLHWNANQLSKAQWRQIYECVKEEHDASRGLFGLARFSAKAIKGSQPR